MSEASNADVHISAESLVERFIPRYVERVKALPVGDPADPATAGIESFTEQRWVTIQHSGRPTYPF